MNGDDGGLPATRRLILRLGLALPASLLTSCAAAGGIGTSRTSGEDAGTAAHAGPLQPTPACHDGDEPTLARGEGPYFTPGSPQNMDLRTSGMPGTPLILTGLVVDRRCRPVGGALLDFWQADAEGAYDNGGFRLRGHQYTAADGTFGLQTIVPGTYGWRTRHLHVKAQVRGGPVLTTQLFFPGEPRNRTDRIFDDRLVMRVADAGGQRQAGFLFVLSGG